MLIGTRTKPRKWRAPQRLFQRLAASRSVTTAAALPLALLLLGLLELGPQLAKACFHTGELVEVSVAGARGDLQLLDCSAQLTLPRIGLRLCLVLQ